MRTVSKIFSCALLLFMITSCNYREPSDTQCVVDYDADSLVYKFSVVDKDDAFYIDNLGKSNVMQKKVLVVGKTIFTGSDKFKKMFSYITKNPHLSKKVQERTSVSIQGKDLNYIDVFTFVDPIYVNIDSDTFSQTDLTIKLDDGPAWSKGKLMECLKLEFTQPDNGEGYKKWILTYTYQDGEWVLVSRERINSILDDEDEYGYCIDSINSNISLQRSKFFYITNELLYELNCGN